MSPGPQTPSGGIAKIKLNVRKSLPSTPAAGVPPSTLGGFPQQKGLASVAAQTTKTKAGRTPVPSARKRAGNPSDDEGASLANGTKPKKLPKINLIKTPATTRPPTLKVKPVGRIPTRPLGEGYDSEAEDREVDPVIEEQLLFRMMEGEDNEYIKTAIAERRIGLPKAQGGADIQLKWLDDEGRRAMLTVQGRVYACVTVDLPTITEAMKTWDKKAMVKSADICQMLLAFTRVDSEEEARNVPLPKAVEHGLRWPHGITPPMHDARNRRFRKRLSKLEIQNKEAEVERLLTADKDAVNTKYEFVGEKQTLDATQEESGEEYEMEDGEDVDAEGEVDDYFGDGDVEGQEQDIDFDLDALEAEFMDAAETPAEQPTDLATPAVGGVDAVTPLTANTGTPAAQTEESGAEGEGAEEESDEDEEEGDDDDDVGDEGDGDEDRHDEVAGVRLEIANLRKQLAQYEQQLATSFQPIMKKRLENSIRNIKSEINLKRSSIGEVDED